MHPHTSPAARPAERTTLLLFLLAGYLLARGALGALVNPSLNGPDEGGHLEYVRTLVESGGRHVTGVESRQPPLFYVLAAVPWRATDGNPEPARLFAVRLLSVGAGIATLVFCWLAARRLWPTRPLLAMATAALASLAPGHLFLLESASNDPLAEALATLALLAALRILRGDSSGKRWWVTWLLASAGAVATKPTALPVLVAAALSLATVYRRVLLASRLRRALGALLALALLVGNLALAARPPTSSLAASAARFWPLAVVRAPFAYVGLGGLAETFRTFWYAYDYGVTWPPAVERLLGGSAAALTLLALAGLILVRGRVGPPPATLLLWTAALAQAALVAGRYGFGDLLHIAMGGAAQAKAFFPASLPLAALGVAGASAALSRLRLRDDRWLALGLFVWLLALDAASLAVALWHHYRWWQIGV